MAAHATSRPSGPPIARDADPVLFCGDPHSQFRHITEVAAQIKASAVILLGDMEPTKPLQEEMRPLADRGVPWYFIGGNHDADSDELALRVWNDETVAHDVHGRVVVLPNGWRLGGLAGVWREQVWYPSASAAREGAPAWRSRAEHARSTPRQDRWQGTLPPRKHLSTIYFDEFERLADLRADILITHEAPGYHRHGVELLDALATQMGVRALVHGHTHDCVDSTDRWQAQGFASVGVGLRGITAIQLDAEKVRIHIVRAGELDAQRD